MVTIDKISMLVWFGPPRTFMRAKSGLSADQQSQPRGCAICHLSQTIKVLAGLGFFSSGADQEEWTQMLRGTSLLAANVSCGLDGRQRLDLRDPGTPEPGYQQHARCQSDSRANVI